jgi:uncharacterized membrane protein YqjE
MVRTFANLRHTGVGAAVEHKLAVSILFPRQYPAASFDRIGGALRDALRELPGVKGAVLSFSVPFSGIVILEVIKTGDGASESPLWCLNDMVSGDYFATMGVPLLAGAGFADTRKGSPGVAVINESLARRLFPGQNPVGRSLRTSSRGNLTIVGVAADLRSRGPRERDPLQFYTPFEQHPDSMTFVQTFLLVLARDESADLRPTISRLVYEADPRLTVTYVRLSDYVEQQVRAERTALVALQGIAGLAILLAGFGVFAVALFTVSQREKELSIRASLGATPAAIRQLVMTDGLRWVTGGTLAGLVAAALLSRSLESLLFEVGKYDPIAFAGTAAVLLAVGVAACWWPAYRGAKIDPVIALRAE